MRGDRVQGPGDLVRPKVNITAGLKPAVTAGFISLTPGDLGMVTYYSEDNGNIEVLCRGKVCQSYAGMWRRMRDER